MKRIVYLDKAAIQKLGSVTFDKPQYQLKESFSLFCRFHMKHYIHTLSAFSQPFQRNKQDFVRETKKVCSEINKWDATAITKNH